jgi:GTP-binding protein
MIKTAVFISSVVDQDKLPKPLKPEYAFIGRSNVGKSSLINMLTNLRKLAKVSNTPGKTRTINHFLIDDKWYLVDLPGFGYAKTSKTERSKWTGFTYEYLKTRDSLLCICVLIDIRLEPQKIDLDFMEWMGNEELPFAMIFTKADKLGKTVIQKNVAAYEKKMLETWEVMPPYIITSSETKQGKDELVKFIEKTNKLFFSGH